LNAEIQSWHSVADVSPFYSVNTDARRRRFALAAVAGYLARWASIDEDPAHFLAR